MPSESHFSTKTQHLVIRNASPIYAPAMLNYKLKNRAFHRPWSFLYKDDHYTLKSFQIELDSFRQDKQYRFLIFLKDQPEIVIGDFCFSGIIKGAFQSGFLGYYMDEYETNKGYMKEALEAGIQYFFKIKKFHRIEANVIPRNKPSRRLLQKLGFEEEGYAKKYLKINGIWEDHIRYALLNQKAAETN